MYIHVLLYTRVLQAPKARLLSSRGNPVVERYKHVVLPPRRYATEIDAWRLDVYTVLKIARQVGPVSRVLECVDYGDTHGSLSMCVSYILSYYKIAMYTVATSFNTVTGEVTTFPSPFERQIFILCTWAAVLYEIT